MKTAKERAFEAIISTITTEEDIDPAPDEIILLERVFDAGFSAAIEMLRSEEATDEWNVSVNSPAVWADFLERMRGEGG